MHRSTQHSVCRPQAPQAAVLVAAENDGYVAPHAVHTIHKHWQGSQLWHASGGHVSSFITLNATFIQAVQQSLAQLDTWQHSTPPAGSPPTLVSDHGSGARDAESARTPVL